MKRTVLFGVLAAAVGVGAASIVYAVWNRRAVLLDPEKSLDHLVDYCQTKVDQLETLLKSLPREATKKQTVAG